MSIITWYDALIWAAERQRPFSTTEMEGSLGIKKKGVANDRTQKLWKWGYIKKATGSRRATVEAKCQQQALKAREQIPQEKGRWGGAGRRQGRYPEIWIVTEKGNRRAEYSYPLSAKERSDYLSGDKE